MPKPVWSRLWKCWLIPDPKNAAFSIRVEPQPPAPLDENDIDKEPEDWTGEKS